MPAAPVHHTVVDKSSAWDGPAEEKKFDKKAADFNKFYAWVDKGEVDPDADGTDREDGWGPHHEVSATGVPGAANLKGLEAAMARLNGESRVPEGDRPAVHAHLAAHYKDAGVDEVPELKAARMARADYHNMPEYRVAPRSQFELREVPNGSGGANLVCTGYASVTCADFDDDTNAYEMEDWAGPFVESIVRGSFKRTLEMAADVAFLLNHSGLSLARTKPGTLKLSEDTVGLHFESLLDPQNLYVQAMRSAVERGDLDECSFAFRVMKQTWNNAMDRRWITEISLNKGDVSLVNFGANPHTGGTVALRQKLPALASSSGLDTGRHKDPAFAAFMADRRARLELARDRARLEALRVPPRSRGA